MRAPLNPAAPAHSPQPPPHLRRGDPGQEAAVANQSPGRAPEPSRAEPIGVESNRAEPSGAEPSRAEPRPPRGKCGARRCPVLRGRGGARGSLAGRGLVPQPWCLPVRLPGFVPGRRNEWGRAGWRFPPRVLGQPPKAPLREEIFPRIAPFKSLLEQVSSWEMGRIRRAPRGESLERNKKGRRSGEVPHPFSVVFCFSSFFPQLRVPRRRAVMLLALGALVLGLAGEWGCPEEMPQYHFIPIQWL